MSRRNRPKKREVLQDPVYHSVLVTRLIKMVMKRGKLSLAMSIVYDALEILDKKKSSEYSNVIEAFEKAVFNITPTVMVVSRAFGGSKLQVPVPVSPAKGLSLALRWLIEAAKKRSENTMAAALGGEMLDALNARGGACKSKEDVEKMAAANRAFAHLYSKMVA